MRRYDQFGESREEAGNFNSAYESDELVSSKEVFEAFFREVSKAQPKEYSFPAAAILPSSRQLGIFFPKCLASEVSGQFGNVHVTSDLQRAQQYCFHSLLSVIFVRGVGAGCR